MYFKQCNETQIKNDYTDQKLAPVNSEIIVSEACFTKKSSQKSKITDLIQFKKDSKIDCLLKCKNCNLTVHQNCYFGILDESYIYGGGGAFANNWICDSCIWSKRNDPVNFVEPICCLCLLRGGALKQTDDKQKWAHITCALIINGITFASPETRSAIQVPSQLFKKEKKLNQICVYCDSFSRYQTTIPNGLTVKCSFDECKNRFHVTCGFSYGKCTFEQANWPHTYYIYCHEHYEKHYENQVLKIIL